MTTFYYEDTLNLIPQERAELDALRAALETGAYEIYDVGNPHHESAQVDILCGNRIIRVNLSRLQRNDKVIGPRGTPVAFTCLDFTVVYYPIPAALRAFCDNLPANVSEWRSDKAKADDERRGWMQTEAEADPEGAFGGRGNNFGV